MGWHYELKIELVEGNSSFQDMETTLLLGDTGNICHCEMGRCAYDVALKTQLEITYVSEEEILLRNYGTCDLTYKPDERDSHGRILVRRPSSIVIIPPAHEVVVPLSGAICINRVPKVKFSFRRYPTDDYMVIKKT